MHLFLAAAASLAGLAAAQSSTTLISSSSLSSNASLSASQTSTFASSTVSSQYTASITALTVALDGSAQFTAINAAIAAAQNSGLASVVVQPGTYSETLVIQGSQTVSILGPSASSYAGNQVLISAAAPTTGVVSFNTQKSQGVTFKNVNITNTAPGASSKAPAVSMSGMNMAFYDCALVSSGTGVYTASYGTTLIANSYIEGPDKLFYNYLTAYVYGSTIVPTISSASIFYAQGASIGGSWYNASLVVDSSTVSQKPGLTNTYVYLAQPNGNYTQAIYRNTVLGSLIAPTALRANLCGYVALWGEFETTGPGAMSTSNSASRQAVCDQALTAAQVSSLTIDQLFGNAFSGFSSSNTNWIDSTVLKAIQSSDATQLANAPVVSSSSSSSSIALSTSTSSGSSSALSASSNSTSASVLSSSASGSSSMISTTSSSGSNSSTPTQTTVALTSSARLTAVTVAPSSAQFSDVNAAISYAQNSGIPSVVVSAGTYSAISIVGTQTITVVGPTATSVANNQVVISASGSVGPLAIGTNNAQGATFRNLNFTNPSTSALAPAANMRAANMAFYGCALVSGGQGVYTASYGTTLISDSYIEGGDKIFYNVPTVYIYRSVIAPIASGTSIFYAKGAQLNNIWYNSTIVVDSSAIIQKPGSSVSGVYLATPNGQSNYTTAIYRNTSMANVISSAGVYSTACSLITTYGEFLTTGPGSISANNAARVAACDYQLTASQVSAYTIDQVFGNNFAGYSSSNVSWIDIDVLRSLQASDAAQVASAPVISSSSSSSVSAPTSSSNATSTSGSASSTCPTPTPGATLVVSQNGTGCAYPNITAALAALPNDSKPYTVLIMPGTYNEQLSVTRNGKVILIGQTTFVNDYTQNQVTIQTSNGQLTSAGQDESTPVLFAKKANDNSGMALYNINFVNTYPKTANTAALAADFYGANIAAYGCSFKGFQDTLLANKGTQVFSNCYIEGSIDFVWGFSTAYFHQCYIASNTPGACISAQGRVQGTVSGYVFDSCYLTYTSTYGSSFGLSYLGRPYSNFSTVVYMNSYIDKQINAAGWNVWSTNNPQTSNVIFGEFNNSGPGSWQSGTARASFASNFTAAQASPYTLSNWIGDTSWLDLTAYNYAPSYSWNTTSTSSTGTSTGPQSTSTASVNAHPDSGLIPSQYAVLVSPNGQVNGSFSNITAALASLPSDNTNQTIFIYAGSYNEQIPSINRPGAVRIIGYTTGNSGQSYHDNQVTITFSRGLSVSPLPVGHSDAETATVSTASNRISFYNINIVNSDNLDGLENSYVTLAGSIYGNDIGFYACSFDGWQDTLLNGATTGYQYYESCYIGGAIDFIWGYSKAYFKGCTIGAKRASSCMTAQSRASASAIGGYIFDNCLFTASPEATVDLTQAVYLGRPYSAYALVVVKNSYLDDVINPSGWKIWSATDPRTDHITFAEFNNTGPGSWQNNVAARQAFGNASLLTSDGYSLSSVMDSTSWIDMTYWNSISTPQPVVQNTTSTNITVSGSSSYNGTTPPSGALIVSKNPIAGQTTYFTIQDALNAAPTSSKTNATIFIYPGTYEEQLIVNKSGTTIFMGYSASTDDFNQNQVTIQQSYGVDTQGDGSDVDAATVYATGNYFYAYNVNFRNNNGTQQNIASLGFAVKSSKYAFMHACQIYGNQDTLYISGNMFAFKSYIEGNVDFIFGAGSGYFLNSTISPNEDGDSITAAKRATNTTQAGFVFDQCSIVPALDASGSASWKNVSLGRPWNNNANVAYIDCYLSSMIGAPGWDIWSKSTPQTEGVIFGEYHNYGPGASVCNRASFSQQLTDSSVLAFQLGNFFTTTSWIDFSVVDVQPFAPGIGSAPSPCGLTTTSSLSSSTLSSTSSLTSSLSTVYVTKIIIDKETATITLPAGETTLTSTYVVTENDGTTITPSPILKTSILKSTTIISYTTTVAPDTITVKSTTGVTSTAFASGKDTTIKVTESQVVPTTLFGKGTTIKTTEFDTVTSTVQGQDSTIKSTIIQLQTETSTQKPATVKATTTSYITSTYSPAPIVSSVNQGTLVTVYQTSSQKGSTVTSTTLVQGDDVTKTTSIKASTSTVLSTSFKTTTKKTTVTAACTTAPARLFRRGLLARALGTTTLTVNATQTSYVKTSTVLLPGQTYSTVITSTLSIYPTSTLKASTSTITQTSLATSTSFVTQSADDATVTSFVTKNSVTTLSQPGNTITSTAFVTSFQTVSLPGSTQYSTVDSTSVITQNLPGNTVTSVVTAYQTTTEVLPASTSTSYKVVTSTSVLSLDQQTSTVYYSKDSTTTLKTTLPASTSTVYKTSTQAGQTTLVTVTPPPSLKTSTVKSTSTVFSTVTKTAKC